jgi:hypothetical protein
MRNIIALAALLLAGLTGCATDATVHSSGQEFPGTYYSGDGLGRNVTVFLRSDGTYYSDWQGCLGVYGESDGTWSLQGDQITFSPANAKDLLAGYLTRATTIRHNGQLGFVRTQDVEHDRVPEQLVFLREQPRQ